MSTQVQLRYLEGCPHWRTAYERLREVLDELGASADSDLALERVESPEEAERLRFIGSPTILVNGRDPFPSPEGAFGFTCRIYETPEGLAGSPTLEQLRRALSPAA